MTAVPHPDTCQTCGYSIRYPQWPGDRCACSSPRPPAPRFDPGARVVVTLHGPGPANPRPAGKLRAIVRNAGAEYDVEIDIDDCDSCWLEDLLAECDMKLADIWEGMSATGGVYVLRNVQAEQLEPA